MSTKTGLYNRVHPVFRILIFIIFSLFLALGNILQAGIAVLLIVILYAMTGPRLLPGLWLMLRRMRWFFLSIFIIYAWLTPGVALSDSGVLADWLPSLDGLVGAGHRLLALVCIVAAVHWLLFVTPREQLVAALYWLMGPLSWFGLPRERVAVRIALILDYVVDLQRLVSQRTGESHVRKRDMKTYASFASSVVEEVILQAEQSVCHTVEVDVADAPPKQQWFWPLLLGLIMWLAG